MIDVLLDSDLDLVLTDQPDVKLVEDADVREQAVRLAVLYYVDPLVGLNNSQAVPQKVALAARRAADLLGFLGDVAAIDVQEHPTLANTLTVRIEYRDGTASAFDVN